MTRWLAKKLGEAQDQALLAGSLQAIPTRQQSRLAAQIAQIPANHQILHKDQRPLESASQLPRWLPKVLEYLARVKAA